MLIKTLLVTAALVAGFVLPALYVEREMLREWIGYGLLVACAVGLFRWVPAAWEVYIKRANKRSSLGILGVVLFLSSIAVWQMYTLYNLRADEPLWLKETSIFNGIVYVLLIGAVLFVTASKFEGETPTRAGKAVVASLMAVGLFFTSLGPLIIKFAGGAIHWTVSLLAHVFP